MSKRINKSLVKNGITLVTEDAWNAELEAKHEKLVEWMKAQHLAGVLIRRNENVAWLTGGAVELRVLTPCETGKRPCWSPQRASATTSPPRMKLRACTTRSLARSILSRCFSPGRPTIPMPPRPNWRAARSAPIRLPRA